MRNKRAKTLCYLRALDLQNNGKNPLLVKRQFLLIKINVFIPNDQLDQPDEEMKHKEHLREDVNQPLHYCLMLAPTLDGNVPPIFFPYLQFASFVCLPRTKMHEEDN